MEPYHIEPSLAGISSSTQAGGLLVSGKEGREGWCVHLQMSLTGWETEARNNQPISTLFKTSYKDHQMKVFHFPLTCILIL